MGEVIHHRSTKKTRKRHGLCYWCGEDIERGAPMESWRWVDGSDAQVIKVHPECRVAWSSLPAWDNEILPYEFARGCTCENGRCACKKESEVGDG